MVLTKIYASSQLLFPTYTPYSSSGLLGKVYGPLLSESLRTLVFKCSFLSLPNQQLLGHGNLHLSDTGADSCPNCHLRTALPNQTVTFPDSLWALRVPSHAVSFSRIPFLHFPTWLYSVCSEVCLTRKLLYAASLKSRFSFCVHTIPLQFLPTSALRFLYCVRVGSCTCL